MAHKYIWQGSKWPDFYWQDIDLINVLAECRRRQGRLNVQAAAVGLVEQADVLIEEALTTSAIEGELLDRHSVRSSVAKLLGLPTAGLPTTQSKIEGLVEMLLDATKRHDKPLTKERLCGWQAALFPTGYSGIRKITVGDWRQGSEPMQVVSGAIGKEKIHYEAPSSSQMNREMKQFLHWWNHPPAKLDGLLRAGIAHFWFVTIHPFDDGNGRLARAITDMAIAQDEEANFRLYSLSSQIMRERSEYYQVLEQTQKGNGDITPWLCWYLGMFVRAIAHSDALISRTLRIAEFWKTHRDAPLNPRQLKVIKRMLDTGTSEFEGGMTNRKYVSLNRVSRETAKRDLAELEKMGIFRRNAGHGRSVSYAINLDVNSK